MFELLLTLFFYSENGSIRTLPLALPLWCINEGSDLCFSHLTLHQILVTMWASRPHWELWTQVFPAPHCLDTWKVLNRFMWISAPDSDRRHVVLAGKDAPPTCPRPSLRPLMERPLWGGGWALYLFNLHPCRCLRQLLSYLTKYEFLFNMHIIWCPLCDVLQKCHCN